MRGWWAGALVALTICSAAAQDAPPKWTAFIDIDGKLGTQRHIGELDAFIPLWQNENTLLFGNLRFRADNQDSLEGNFGLALRHMLFADWNVGAYGYFDRRKSPRGNAFSQVTLGAELLGRDFDFRFNGYIPVGEKWQSVGTSGGASTASVGGGGIVVNTAATMLSVERSLGGFDAEVGWRVPILPAEGLYALRLFAGGFRFDDGAGTIVAGPRLRAEFVAYEVPELWPGARFSASLEWLRDDVRGDQGFAGLRLRVPLQPEAPRAATLMERRMADPINRDVDIVTNVSQVVQTPALSETATQTSGGQTLVGIDSGTTTGAALPGAVAAAGNNSTVVLSGTFNTSGIVTLQTGQTLMGSGTLSVVTPSGRTVSVSLGGATITGAVAGNNPAVAMANNSTLTGLTVTNTATGGGTPNPFAVRANGVTGAVISNNTLRGFGDGGGGTAQALLITGASSSIQVLNNTLSATGTTGITVGLNVVNSTDIFVLGNTMSAISNPPATQSRAIVVNNGSFRAGSTGNTILNGMCSVSLAGTGSIGLTDGTTCP